MTITKEVPARGGATFAPEDRRRSQRVIIRMPVTLAVTIDGKDDRILAHTVAVNVHGAMIISARNLDPDTKLMVLNERTGQKKEARVTRASRQSPEGHLIPIEFTSPAPDFWQISFPATNWKPSDS